jgi:gliding motility-associated-like protein
MRLFVTIVIILFPLLSIGQLVTNVTMSPAALVQNVLLGSGVTVSNITYNGSPAAIGSFTANGTNLGINQGVVITTGTVANNGQGPHGPNNQANAGVDNGVGGFSLLSNLLGNAPTFNAAILEFDFVPYSDSVKFNYVFGSEEYPEYVGTNFNDIFAFFISGPGIAGLQNIAKLPSGQTVAINNVNAGTNPFYFVGNGNGSQAPYNASSNYIQYDGFTKVLTAKSKVQCGQTYHLIISIADVADAIYDSGIFLEANSLTSDTPVDISYQLSQQVFTNPNSIAEDCVTTTVTLKRDPSETASPLTFPVNVSGTAIEGVDYSSIPNSITFPAGVSQVQFSFNAFQDGIIEGQESIILNFPILDPCGNENPIILNLFIEDILPVAVEIEGNQMICPGDSVTLLAIPSGGAPPYSYLWSNGATTQSIVVSPAATSTYSVSVTDNCLNETATNNYQVVVPVFSPLILNETSDIVEICPYVPMRLESNASGGAGIYTYQWSSNFEADLGVTQNIIATPSTTTTYTIVVTDACGNETVESILYTITSPPLVLTMSPEVEICPGDSVEISVSATGGYGDYFYNWLHSGETTSSVWVKPSSTTSYTVSVSDECQTFTVEGTTQVIVIKPTANFTATSSSFFNGLPVTFINQSINAVDYEWEFGDGNSSTFAYPSNTYIDPGLYYVTLVAIDEKGCRDTIVKPLNIEEEWYLYVPNTFTPDGDRSNNIFYAKTIGIKELSISIFNRWGQIVYTSKEINFNWDGTIDDGIMAIDGTYIYSIDFTTNSGRYKTIHGHVNLLK